MVFDSSVKITRICYSGSEPYRVNFKFKDKQYSIQEASDKLYLRELKDNKYSVVQSVDIQHSLGHLSFSKNQKTPYNQIDTTELLLYLNAHFSENGQYVFAKQCFQDKLKSVLQILANFTHEGNYYTENLDNSSKQKICKNLELAIQQLQSLLDL